MKKTSFKTFAVCLVLVSSLIYLCNCEKNKYPKVSTKDVTSITATKAESGGDIEDDGENPVTSRGVCFSSANQTPSLKDSKTTNGFGTGSFISVMENLTPETKYYVRAYAITLIDTLYGKTVTFTTTKPITVTDIDGNIYKAVIIGDQVWMAENLKVTRYRNGDPIPKVVDNDDWEDLTTGAYCIYDNEEQNRAKHGLHYNWFTVVDSRGLAPVGWHIPTEEEWQTLINTVGQSFGYYLMEPGEEYWEFSNPTNKTGFSARGSGYRTYAGDYIKQSFHGYYWSSTQDDVDWRAKHMLITNQYSIGINKDSKKSGMSVRCVKD